MKNLPGKKATSQRRGLRGASESRVGRGRHLLHEQVEGRLGWAFANLREHSGLDTFESLDFTSSPSNNVCLFTTAENPCQHIRRGLSCFHDHAFLATGNEHIPGALFRNIHYCLSLVFFLMENLPLNNIYR